jgi:hypothetical protein
MIAEAPMELGRARPKLNPVRWELRQELIPAPWIELIDTPIRHGNRDLYDAMKG